MSEQKNKAEDTGSAQVVPVLGASALLIASTAALWLAQNSVDREQNSEPVPTQTISDPEAPEEARVELSPQDTGESFERSMLGTSTREEMSAEEAAYQYAYEPSSGLEVHSGDSRLEDLNSAIEGIFAITSEGNEALADLEFKDPRVKCTEGPQPGMHMKFSDRRTKIVAGNVPSQHPTAEVTFEYMLQQGDDQQRVVVVADYMDTCGGKNPEGFSVTVSFEGDGKRANKTFCVDPTFENSTYALNTEQFNNSFMQSTGFNEFLDSADLACTDPQWGTEFSEG